MKAVHRYGPQHRKRKVQSEVCRKFVTPSNHQHITPPPPHTPGPHWTIHPTPPPPPHDCHPTFPPPHPLSGNTRHLQPGFPPSHRNHGQNMSLVLFQVTHSDQEGETCSLQLQRKEDMTSFLSVQVGKWEQEDSSCFSNFQKFPSLTRLLIKSNHSTSNSIF